MDVNRSMTPPRGSSEPEELTTSALSGQDSHPDLETDLALSDSTYSTDSDIAQSVEKKKYSTSQGSKDGSRGEGQDSRPSDSLAHRKHNLTRG